MKQCGTVIELLDNNMALVNVNQSSACDNCRTKDACATKGKVVTAKAYNEAGATVGDSVNLQTPSSYIVVISFLIFVLPVIVALLGYFIGKKVFADDVMPYVLSLICFVVLFIILNFTLNKYISKKNIVRITSIAITEKEDKPINPEDTKSEYSDLSQDIEE